MDVLFEHYKLPQWIKEKGGDLIFNKFEIKSRTEVKNMISIGHDLESESDASDSQMAEDRFPSREKNAPKAT